MALHGIRGIFSHVREYPLWTPKRTQGALPLDPAIASEQLEELQCLPIALPMARRCRVSTATRSASASIIRCCAAVGGSAALRMRHTPCGCRSAYLVGVRTNFRLPPVSTMRRAQQCRYFASSLPPCYRHSHLTIVRRGCKRSRIAGIHGEAMYTALTLRSACSHSSYKLPMSGVEVDSPRLSLGDSKGVFSSEREYPLWCRGAHAAPPPALARENQDTPLEKGVKKTRHICGRSFSELISNNACCGSYGRPRSSCGA